VRFCLTFSFIATTTTGFEDIAAWEVEKLIGAKAQQLHGKILFEASINQVIELNLWSRTLHRIILLLCRDRVETLEDVYRVTASIDFTDYIERGQSFAVRAERIGEHPFTSIDVAAKAGQAVIDSFMSKTGHRLKVNLDKPDVEIFCQLKNSDFYIGLNTTGESLHRRNYRVFDHPAALKTTIASAMIYWSNWGCEEPILDPMCGGGTIPIEAALIARNIAPGLFRREFAFGKLFFIDRRYYEEAVEKARSSSNKNSYRIYGSDISPKFIEGAWKNAASAGVEDTVKFRCVDATKLDKIEDLEVKYVVVNPPYGIRSLRDKVVERLYVNFLSALKRKGGGLLVAITASDEEFKRALDVNGLEVLGVKRVFHGALLTSVFKCAF